MLTPVAQIYFSDFFNVPPELLDEYGAFDVSLINDLPLFVDPFLLFNSDKPEYRQLHKDIIDYLRFLRDQSLGPELDPGLIASWYQFKEVKQNWLGFSKFGNKGNALGPKFAHALHSNLGSVFRNFGEEQVTRGSHLEKLCLIDSGVGRDNISDFTTSLIKAYLLDYTEQFALQHVSSDRRRVFNVQKVRFNDETKSWESGRFELPSLGDDFVLLTPKDMLTRDETWISRPDLLNRFEQLVQSLPNDQLRAQLNHYLWSQLMTNPDMSAKERKKEQERVVQRAVREHPEIIEYYIRDREDSGDQASNFSARKVSDTEEKFVQEVRDFVASRLASTAFYKQFPTTSEEVRERIHFLKHVIEDQGGYRLFYRDGAPLQREADLQLIFKFVWFATPSAVDAEVNNGRGPVDFSIARGALDKTLVEFKLANNSKLKHGLTKQVEIYERAGDSSASFKVIIYFTSKEREKVNSILEELGLQGDSHIILIDAIDDKPSASRA